jgi:hypothetical protein
MSDVQTFCPSFLNPSLITYYHSAKLSPAKRTEDPSQVLKRYSIERRSVLSSTSVPNELVSLRHNSTGTARPMKLTRPLTKLSVLAKAKIHPSHIQSLQNIERGPLRLRLSGATTTLKFPASRTVFLTVPVHRSPPRKPKLEPIYSRQELKLDWKVSRKQMTDQDLYSLVESKKNGRFKWSCLN